MPLFRRGTNVEKTKTEMKWYAVSAYYGKENEAELALRERIGLIGNDNDFGEILIPTAHSKERRVTQDKEGVETVTKRVVEKKAFPGYILVEMNMTGDTWHLVNDTPKVSGFVGNTRNPRPVRQREIDKIKSRMATGTFGETRVDFDEGEDVSIMEGPFKGFNGQVGDVNDEKRTVKVLVSVFGRPTPVELPYDSVEKITVV